MPIQYGNNDGIDQRSGGLEKVSTVLIQDLSSSFGLTLAKSASIIAVYEQKCHSIHSEIHRNGDLLSTIINVCQNFLNRPNPEALFSFYFFKKMLSHDLLELDVLLEFLTWVEDELGLDQNVLPLLFIHLIGRS